MLTVKHALHYPLSTSHHEEETMGKILRYEAGEGERVPAFST